MDGHWLASVEQKRLLAPVGLPALWINRSDAVAGVHV